MERPTYIYRLIDPNSEVVRYVGKSIHPKKRMGQHLKSSKSAKLRLSHTARWIKKLED